MGTETKVVMGPKRRRRRRWWGTWEELILGGAVLRHGTQDWDAVASELRTRTLYPYCFTPEACKAKYEDLQKRYSGCTAWFEELRKRRMAELKRELEKSEESIGSLELNIESLKREKGQCNQVDYGSSWTESPAPLVKSEDVECLGRELSKDGLSAGSFTQDPPTNWSPGNHIQAVASAAETATKPEVSAFCEPQKIFSIKELTETSNELGQTVWTRRGKRKRKDCNNDVKEASIGESDNLGSNNVVTSFSHDRGLCRPGSGKLMEIFNSIAENENALVFRRRLDSQKRARYKKIIRQHEDFGTIRSRIASCSIKTVRELFRDLLLLANNALVFYSRRTREYKSALRLRDLVMKLYRQHQRDMGNKIASPILYMSPLCSPPVKPRSIRPRPFQRILSLKLPSSDDAAVSGTPHGCKELGNDGSYLSVMAKTGFYRPVKIKQGSPGSRAKIPLKEREKGTTKVKM